MGGPVFLVVAYCIITGLVFGIVTATTEMSSYLPVPGPSMSYYASRFFSNSLGFALGWMYCYIFVITVPAEITAASLVIQYWSPPVRVAVISIIGLIIMAVVLVFGGGPNRELLSFHYWKHPAPVNEYLVPGHVGRLSAFVATICHSVYAFGFAPELLIVTGGEMESPRPNLPTAGKRYFYRLVLFYIIGAFAISLILSSDDPKLLGGGSGAGASPWAIAARNAGIVGLDSVINTVILLSALSAGNSYFYMSTRALYSTALIGSAPRFLMKCTKSGVPYNAVACTTAICLLSYLNVSSTGATVFNWFVNLINTGAFQSWICVCIVYLRFRKAIDAQSVTDLPYRSRFQPYMSYISGGMFSLLLLLNGFKNFIHGHWDTSNFLTCYIALPIFLVL
ncbi:lysine-specific permease [Aspergillus flavus]|nr:lysine-specific permease [Aspergillus flavus]RAQ72218.1 lysine-specific permease [Aspergillus flavus]